MPREDWLTRPSWWPRHVPIRCPDCHQPMLPGQVRIRWAPCRCVEDGEPGHPAGHDVWRCARGDCRFEVWPPEHRPGEELPAGP